MTSDINTAVSLLKENDNFLILTHVSPDGDTIGGGTALLLALRKSGKRARLVCGDPIPDKYMFAYSLAEDDNFKEDFVVSVDVADVSLLGKEIAAEYGAKVDLSIDHHQNVGRNFAFVTYCDSNAPAVCELMYNIICAMGVEIDKNIASCLYLGLATDTGCFRYSNVRPATHITAARLIEAGADYSKINTLMFETKSLAFFRLQRLCLENMEIYHNGKVCIIAVTRDMLEDSGAQDWEIDPIIPMSRQIEGVKVGVTLKQKPDGSFKASVRTDEDIDAAAICRVFGGGGHLRAAGCSFECSADDAVDSMLKEIEKHLN